jgi:hypothetical protein
VTTGLHRQATTVGQLTASALVSRHGHQDEPAAHRPVETAMLFIPSRAATGRATETATLFILSSASTARFKVNTNVQLLVRDPTILFGIRKNCLIRRRSLLLHQFTKRVTNLAVIINFIQIYCILASCYIRLTLNICSFVRQCNTFTS